MHCLEIWLPCDPPCSIVEWSRQNDIFHFPLPESYVGTVLHSSSLTASNHCNFLTASTMSSPMRVSTSIAAALVVSRCHQLSRHCRLFVRWHLHPFCLSFAGWLLQCLSLHCLCLLSFSFLRCTLLLMPPLQFASCSPVGCRIATVVVPPPPLVLSTRLLRLAMCRLLLPTSPPGYLSFSRWLSCCILLCRLHLASPFFAPPPHVSIIHPLPSFTPAGCCVLGRQANLRESSKSKELAELRLQVLVVVITSDACESKKEIIRL
jgi:hypothetical protein